MAHVTVIRQGLGKGTQITVTGAGTRVYKPASGIAVITTAPVIKQTEVTQLRASTAA